MRRKRGRVGYILFVVLFLGFFNLVFSGFEAETVRGQGESPRESPYCYLAEGCTRDGFETWLTICNMTPLKDRWGYPNLDPDDVAFLEVDYVTNEGVVATKRYETPPQTRITINVNAEIGPGYDVSFRVRKISTYTAVIFAERPMYFSYVGRGGHEPWQGGHVNGFYSGKQRNVDEYTYGKLSDVYYFAEGTTREGFDEWICVLNPNDEPVKLVFDYMVEGGKETITRVETLKANHRGTWFVPDHVGRGKDVSLKLMGSAPVFAERPMYFAYKSVNPQRPGRIWYGGHVISGVDKWAFESVFSYTFSFAPLFYVPDMGWADTWVCLQNPNDVPVVVRVCVSTRGGMMASIKELPPKAWSTFYYPELIPEGQVSRDPGGFYVYPEESVYGPPPYLKSQKVPHFIVERPLYMEFDKVAPCGQTPSGGTVVGIRISPDYNFFPEGYTGPGFETWMAVNMFDDSVRTREGWEKCLKDPSERSAYTFDCFFPDGTIKRKTLSVCKLAQKGVAGFWETALWRVKEDFPDTDISIVTAEQHSPERIMLFSYKGKWVGMHSSLGAEEL